MIVPKLVSTKKLPSVPYGFNGAYWYRGYAIQMKGGYYRVHNILGMMMTGALPVKGTLEDAKKFIDVMQDKNFGGRAYIFYSLGAPDQYNFPRVWGEGKLTPEIDKEFFGDYVYQGEEHLSDRVVGRPVRAGQTFSWQYPGLYVKDLAPNKVAAGPNCGAIIEGRFFEPASLNLPIDAIEPPLLDPSLQQTLDIDPQNSVYGFIDYLMAEEGLDNAWDITEKIMAQVGCPGEVLESAWATSLADRISPWVEAAGGIPFNVG